MKLRYESQWRGYDWGKGRKPEGYGHLLQPAEYHSEIGPAAMDNSEKFWCLGGLLIWRTAHES